MAGLAFDVHVRDIRPDLTEKAAPITVSTFWLDVMEAGGNASSGEDYVQKNQFWLTAKYGGFDLSKGSYNSVTNTYSPFPINPTSALAVNPNDGGAGVGASSGAYTYTAATPSITFPTISTLTGQITSTGTMAALPLAAWNTSAAVDDHGNYQPDQYYQAGSPSKMAAGLNSAFKKISASIPSGTAAALALGANSVSTTSTNTNYVATYSTDYSGDVIAQTVSFAQGGGVLSESTVTKAWDAQSFLPPSTTTGFKTYSTRVIATSTAQGSGKGVAFTAANLTNLGTSEKNALGTTTSLQTTY